MAERDLSTMDLSELQTLRKDVDKAIAQHKKNKWDNARDALEAKAKELGFRLAELAGEKTKKKPSSPVNPKYRHPENDTMTWSGRGRQPAWFREAVEAGAKPESMLID